MQKNVILITIDSLRRDSVGFLNPHSKSTPYLDRLAKKSTVMTNAFSAGGGTIYSISSLMTSSFPIINLKDTTIKGWPTLAESFRRRGYSTAAFHSNPWLSQPFGFDQGFDKFVYTVPDFPTEDVVGVGPLAQRIPEAISEFADITIKDTSLWTRGPLLFEQATRWIKSLERKDPYFVWIHPMDLHFPYTYPTTPMKRLRPSRFIRYGFDFLVRYSDNRVVNAIGKNFSLLEEYKESVRYLDKALEGFCEQFPESIIVIMSDHGDLFGEHGCFQHPGYLYNEIIKVPILVYEGDHHQHRVIRTNFSTAETGQLIKSLSTDGRTINIEPKIREMFSVHIDYNAKTRRTSIVDGSSKLMVTEDLTKRTMTMKLHDIERDPTESHDMSDKNQDLINHLMSLRANVMKTAEKEKVRISLQRLIPMFQRKPIRNRSYSELN